MPIATRRRRLPSIGSVIWLIGLALGIGAGAVAAVRLADADRAGRTAELAAPAINGG